MYDSDYDNYSEGEVDDYYMEQIDEDKIPFNTAQYNALTGSSSAEELKEVLKNTSIFFNESGMRMMFDMAFMPNKNVNMVSPDYSGITDEDTPLNLENMFDLKPEQLYLFIHKEYNDFSVYLGRYARIEENSAIVLEKCIVYTYTNFVDHIILEPSKTLIFTIESLPDVYCIKSSYDTRQNYLKFKEGIKPPKTKTDAKKIGYLSDPHLSREVTSFFGGKKRRGGSSKIGGKTRRRKSKKTSRKMRKTRRK